jgi:N-acetylglucosaminyldiphosphoundecaprenol N-acetyl-beta-D-mannosaminyltransferase
MKNLNFENVLGYQITTLSQEDCVKRAVSYIDSNHRGKYFVCANPHSIEIATKDAIFKSAIQNADMVVPDGAGIIIASKIMGGSIRQRITGSDMFLGISKALNQRTGFRYFFMGATISMLEKITQKMKTDFSNITVVGVFAPPYKDEFSLDDDRLMIESVNNCKPDVLWIGFSAPKQEKWIFKNKSCLDVKFIGPIGAAFDFYIGTVRRSHQWFQNHGLEWLPRFLQEPRRLWKRTFVSAPLFLLRVLRERLSVTV